MSKRAQKIRGGTAPGGVATDATQPALSATSEPAAGKWTPATLYRVGDGITLPGGTAATITAATQPAEPPRSVPSPRPLPSPRDLLYWEDRVADSLGIARDRVREIRERHLVSPQHFFTSHGAIVFTDAGLARLLEQLNPAPAAAAPTADAPQPPPGPAPRDILRVLRVPVTNKKLLLCARPDGKPGEVPVRVRDNSNFRPGMDVPALLGAPNFWQHYGRLPRRLGRW